MTGRDRMVLMAVIVVAILGAGWVLVVSPERNKANSIGAEVTTAQASLTTAEGELSKARAAQSQYAAAYSSIVSLGKAVPASKEVPSLIVQLARASEQKNVFFSSISSTSTTGAASTSATDATAAAGFTAMPFSFVFDGSFFDLEKLMRKLTSFTTRTASGALSVNGRLLTIQSVNLTPSHTEAVGSGSKASSELTGTVTASAYVLPGGQSVTGSSPVPGAGTPTSSTTGAASSPTAPATVSVTP